MAQMTELRVRIDDDVVTALLDAIHRRLYCEHQCPECGWLINGFDDAPVRDVGWWKKDGQP